MSGGSFHLLRPFTDWPTGKSVSAAERWIATMDAADEFSTWTVRRPARAAELDGGSVYFVQARHTVFRMPFLRVARDGDMFAIVMAAHLIRVECKMVGFLRGWRYLDRTDAPADIAPRVNTDADAMPPEMYTDLRDAGLV